ncbi:1-phosphofructokinase family hexose kinase [Actinoplanes couchii]|uniref:Tagatose-6-phosphate kinase n=1 Tax=Actinoplanes couchii TaxID=403638 RepID=A0ABQ3XTF2_9ACTN|nr:hexose kinase [Actinoplanes couchii]MDR6319961.1 1-phosphofructokinase/tagatose 6-phosphate kinase [Actinoplanes couchii]GID61657.1 tagatose-6-phosphate kinase [Actinoplanes couchii]
MTRVVTVTLNPAVDITYDVPELQVGGSVRISGVRSRAGGKGVNVAAVVRALGGDSVVVAPTTLTTPDPFRDGLDLLGLDHHLVPAVRAVRHTVAVVGADGATTILLEPGSPVEGDAEPDVVAAVSAELRTADALVISGSVAPGLSPHLPARLAAMAAGRGVPVIADVSGPALRAVPETGAVLTPNHDEFTELTGHHAETVRDVAALGRRVIEGGAAAVVVTLGSRGAVAVTRSGAWYAPAAAAVDGNPTGAGDAAAAALALWLAHTAAPISWADALADAVATSAACVLRPVAGEIDLQARARWRDTIIVEDLT